MVALTDLILSVEHADAHSPGCAWHRDPACLCDVDRDKFIVGDGPYVTSPLLERFFVNAEDDSWLEDAYLQMYMDTAVRGMSGSADEVVALLEEEPELAMKMAEGAPIRGNAERLGERWHAMRDLKHVLGMPPATRQGYGNRVHPQLRAEIVRLYDEEGMGPREIYRHLQSRGVEMKFNTLYAQIRRYTRTWKGTSEKRTSEKRSKATSDAG